MPNTKSELRSCTKCDAIDWSLDARYGKLVCSSCGWQPRDGREQEIRDALQPGDLNR